MTITSGHQATTTAPPYAWQAVPGANNPTGDDRGAWLVIAGRPDNPAVTVEVHAARPGEMARFVAGALDRFVSADRAIARSAALHHKVPAYPLVEDCDHTRNGEDGGTDHVPNSSGVQLCRATVLADVCSHCCDSSGQPTRWPCLTAQTANLADSDISQRVWAEYARTLQQMDGIVEAARRAMTVGRDFLMLDELPIDLQQRAALPR